MKSSTHDQAQGNVRKKGEIKETGKHINNPDLEREVINEKIIGKEDLPDDHVLMSGKEKVKMKR